MQSSATLCFLGAAAPRRKKIRRPPLKPTDLSIIAEDVNEALVSEHPLGHVSSFANKVVLRPPIPDAGDNPAREPRAPKAPLKLVGMLRPQKKTLAAQERQPQPLQSPFRRNPTRQAQMCQNAQRQNPLHLAPVLDQDLLKRRLEESAAKELADMMNSCRETAYAAMAEEARRKRQCEDDELAKRHAEEAIRHAKRTQNPFADLGGGDAQRPSPPPRRLSNRPGPVLTSRWSRWVPVNNTRGGGNARRRKCGYCNWGVAVVRQRILWQQRYEMLDLCCVCELKRQRGEILLENEKWNVVYESSSSEEGDDVYMSNTDTAPPAAVAPRRRPSQVRQIPAVPIRSLGIQFCSTVWAQNPVRTLMAKAASLNLLGLVRGTGKS
ncbi:hypothetical protein SCUCBS95973_001677 [Sporothrix curviconia]|uniref:Uncharacterized protein n=1 Tax=Sporothrix curviconia TaxID=1260050 RepID=A0ABP0B0I9_9PEZI